MRPLRNLVVLIALVMLGWSLAACGKQEAESTLSTPTDSPLSQPSPANIEETAVMVTAAATATEEATGTPVPTFTPTAEPSSTAAPEPADTATSVPTPAPTIAPTKQTLSLDDPVLVEEGGFSFQPISGFLMDVYKTQAGVYSEDDEIILYMITGPTNEEKSLQEMMEDFVATAGGKFDGLTAGESYAFSIDGEEGLAVDVTGALYGDDLEGTIAMAAPDESMLITVFGFAVNERWRTIEGSEVFDAVIGSVAFTADDSATDDDPDEAESDFLLPMPSGQAGAAWHDLPVMPQAIAGEGDNESYYFTVEASVDEVLDFYEIEMGKLDWSLLGTGEGETGALLMIFQKDDEVASISIFSLDDDIVYVFMVK